MLSLEHDFSDVSRLHKLVRFFRRVGATGQCFYTASRNYLLDAIPGHRILAKLIIAGQSLQILQSHCKQRLLGVTRKTDDMILQAR